MSVLNENDSCRLSNQLQTHIFWNFDHISRIYNKINYRNMWFPKVIIILIMKAQALFLKVFFSEKDPHLNVVEQNQIPPKNVLHSRKYKFIEYFREKRSWTPKPKKAKICENLNLKEKILWISFLCILFCECKIFYL